MNECSDEIRDCAARLSALGGQIHMMCPAPYGASASHTHITVEKNTKIECGQNCLSIYYRDSPDRLCYMVPYSSIAYVLVKKK